jgi:hypothetical protein
MLQTKDTSSFSVDETITHLEKVNKCLQERRFQSNNRALRYWMTAEPEASLASDDPYLQLEYDKHPHFVGFDAYMLPAVALSLMLEARAEHDMLTGVMATGLSIEAGKSGTTLRGIHVIWWMFHHCFHDFVNLLLVRKNIVIVQVSSRKM